MKNIKSVLFVLSLVFSVSVYAQNTGRITGKITDKEAKEAAIGVNVILEGTRYGAATDIDGNYAINNVPPGEYTIIVSAIGYQKIRINKVTVKNNLTTKQDILISSTTLELTDEVVVTADRPLIQKDLTSTSSIVTAEELKAMPVENIGQVINLQAGVVGGHFRGGRSNEVAYLVDGVPVTDVFNNNLGIEIENNTIRQLEVISGTFNAEYGQAMSGVVNTITKQGSQKYESSISSYVGNHYSSDTKIFRNLDKPFSIQSYDVQGSFSGPIPMVSDLTFFTNIRYFTDDGYYFGKRVYNITDPTLVPNFFPAQLKINNKTGDNAWVSMNPYHKTSFQGKLSYSQSDYLLSYLLIYDNNQSQGYRHDMLYSPDGRKTYYGSNSVQSLQYTYIPDANTFHKVNLSFSTHDAWGYLYKNPNDPRYLDSNVGSTPDNNLFPFRIGGNEVDRYKRYTNSVTAQWSLTSQLNTKHKLGAGLDAKYHDLFSTSTSLQNYNTGEVDSVTNQPIYELVYPSLHSAGNLSYLQHPYEFSGYIQDKMEYDMMIVNLGLRFDYFNANTTVPADIKNPENNPNFPGAGKTKKVGAKFQLSPRLGVSFPITDQGAIHFSYGHFFQMPSYDYLYTNSEYAFATSGNSISDIIGNPDLKPQQTVMYELGLQQVVAENMSLEFTVYYRDIRNLLGTEIIDGVAALKFARYTNRDYGNVKGMILTADKQFSDYWSAKLDYTYQIAEGNASDPLQAFYYINESPPREPEKKTVSLDWDQRSTLNATLTFGQPGNWTVSSIFSYGAGYPYTEDDRNAQGVRFLNGGIKPSTYSVDLRAEKSFDLYSYRINTFLLVYNLLNIENEYGVYSSTGRANRDIYIDQYIKNGLYNEAAWKENINDPSRYSAPRNIKIGASVSF